MKSKYLLLFLFSLSLSLKAEVPAGYYTSADGKTGYVLKTALYEIIKDHTALQYNELYAAYETTDTKSGNVVWDMYSDVPGGTPAYVYYHGTANCGNYSGEGDCYNREHTLPQSWFNEQLPMRTDLYHVIPTDGYVNNRRGSYPLGDVGNVSWTSTNGSKLGSSDSEDYSGTVFEPIDEYKGDFARIYFYMATRYENLIASWENNGTASEVLDGSSDQVFQNWVVNTMLQWHKDDPVSAKEINRNDAVYAIQYNRNPFVDHPEYVTAIWDKTVTPPDTVIPVSTCESFANMTSGSSSYSYQTWTGDNGLTWKANLARTDQTIDDEAICLKGDNAAYIQSGQIDGGISRLSFVMQQKFSGSGGIAYVYINNVLQGQYGISSSEEQVVMEDLNISGSFDIKLNTNGEVRVAFDNICYDNYTSVAEVTAQALETKVWYVIGAQQVRVQLSNDSNNGMLQVFNLAGSQLYQGIVDNRASLRLNLPKGIYIYSVRSNGTRSVGKFVVDR